MSYIFSNSLLAGFFAQAQAPAPGGAGGGGMNMFILFGLMFVIMYFLVIRPQRKEEKKKKEMWSALKKGDSVVTQGGIHGTVQSVNQEKQTTVIKVGESNNKITFDVTAVVRVKSDN